MARNKVTNKNKSVSISLTELQKQFIDKHPSFNLSKFVQIALGDYINLHLEVERLEKEERTNVKQEIIN